MDISILFDSAIFQWIVLPILIFLARVADVSIGTLRIIFISRGEKLLAPLLGFFESIIWLLATSQIMQHLDNYLCFIAYGGGFALGNLVGIIFENKLAIGYLVVRIITPKEGCSLNKRLIEAGYGVTIVNGHGASKEVYIIYSVIKRKNLKDFVEIVEKCNSKTFYSIEDARGAYQGIFPVSSGRKTYISPNLNLNKMFRKRK